MSKVNILITAEDQTRGVIRSLTNDVRQLDGAGGAFGKTFGFLKSAIGTGFKVAMGAGAVGVGALAFGLTKAVQAGSDAQEMMSAFNTVFATTSDKVAAATDKFAASVGRSKFAMRDMAMQFGDTFKPMGFTEQAAGDLSVTMSKLAVDLSSFKNMPVQEAFERLQATLIGNHENALAFGVIINENTLKAELARMGADRFTGAMLEQAKVQARINLLMAGTTDAQGDAARTASGWANQMRRVQSVFADTAATIGLKLMPVVTPFLSAFGDMADYYAPRIITAFDGLVSRVSSSLDTFKLEFDEAGGGMAGFFAGLGSITGATVTLNAKDMFLIDWGGFELGFDPLMGGITKIKWDNVFEFSRTEKMNLTTKKYLWFDFFEFSKTEKLGFTVERKFALGDLFSFTIDADNTVKIKVAAQPEIVMNEAAWRLQLRQIGLMGLGVPISVEPTATKKSWKWSELFSFDWSGFADNATTFKPKKLGASDLFSFDISRTINIALSVTRIAWETVFAFGRKESVSLSVKLNSASESLAGWLDKMAEKLKFTPTITSKLAWGSVFGFSLDWIPIITMPLTWASAFAFSLDWAPTIAKMLSFGDVFSFVQAVALSPVVFFKLSTFDTFLFGSTPSFLPKIAAMLGYASVFIFGGNPAFIPAMTRLLGMLDVFGFGDSPSFFPKISWPSPPGWITWLMGWNGAPPSGAAQGTGTDAAGKPKGHAMGTSFFPGGRTFIAERGPEAVTLPSGSQIHNATETKRMMDSGGLGGGGTTIVIQNAYMRSDQDVTRLAYEIDDIQTRRRR